MCLPSSPKRTDPNGLGQSALKQQLKWFEPKWLRVYILDIMSDAIGVILHFAIYMFDI
jgi:hypothetical protein